MSSPNTAHYAPHPYPVGSRAQLLPGCPCDNDAEITPGPEAACSTPLMPCGCQSYFRSLFKAEYASGHWCSIILQNGNSVSKTNKYLLIEGSLLWVIDQ